MFHLHVRPNQRRDPVLRVDQEETVRPAFIPKTIRTLSNQASLPDMQVASNEPLAHRKPIVKERIVIPLKKTPIETVECGAKAQSPKKILIYVLCQNDESEKLARRHFAKYTWASIFRLDQASMHSGLYENIMQLEELPLLKSEWSLQDYVGTLSYKAYNKINLSRLDRQFQLALEWDTVFFCSKGVNVHVAQNQHPNFSKIWNDVIRDQCSITSTKTALYNFWMAKPDAMQSYLNFFQDMWRLLIRHELLLTDAKQKGYHTKESILQQNGRPQQVHTPFILERVPRNYFQDYQFTVLDMSSR